MTVKIKSWTEFKRKLKKASRLCEKIRNKELNRQEEDSFLVLTNEIRAYKESNINFKKYINDVYKLP